MTPPSPEMCLVTALSIAPEEFLNARGIHSHHFANPTLRKVWDIFERLNAKNEPWSLLILHTEGDGEVKNWVEKFEVDFDTWFNPPPLVKSYAHRVRDAYMQRLAAGVMAEVSQNGKADPAEFQSVLQARLSAEELELRMDTLQNAAKNAFNQIEKASQSDGLMGVETGFRELDNFFRGFQKGKLYILAARPSMGKSAFMLNLALNASERGNVVYIQALEESSVSIAMRAFARTARVPNENLHKGQLNSFEWNKITATLGDLGQLSIFLDDASTLSASEICKRIRIAHQKCPLDLVCIDHLQEIIGNAASRHLEISEACSYFKAIAKELEIPVLLVSQLSRVVEMGSEKRPRLSHLKESGDIEQKADVVMMLYRPHYYDPKAPSDEVEISIPKNRDGRTGKIILRWEPSFMCFADREAT